MLFFVPLLRWLYEQRLERFLGDIPLQRPARFGKVPPLVFAAETNSDKVQAESAVNFDTPSAQAECSASLTHQQQTLTSKSPDPEEPKAPTSACHSQTSKSVIDTVVQSPEQPDINSEIYRRNRLDFALDVGWHPVNIPFIYDFAAGDSYNMTPLKYTLVPIIASLRWQVTNVGWPWIFRGNMDFTFSGSITPIPRGPEKLTTTHSCFEFAAILYTVIGRQYRSSNNEGAPG